MLWSVVAASALVLALMHALVWTYDRRAHTNLTFAIVAFSVVGISWAELAMMSAGTATEWANWLRWYQLPNFFLVCGTMLFVRLCLGTNKPWLMWTIVALRAVILLVNFAVEPNFNFQRVDTIDYTIFLGEEVATVGRAITSPRQALSTLAGALSLLFILDAAVSHWRRGTADARRKALIVGGSIAFFFAIAVLNRQLVFWGLITFPTLTAPPFLITLAAMAFEMSRDTLRASRLARELRESEQALDLAASAAGFGMWSWDPEKQRIWATERARAVFGIDARSPVDLERLEAMIPRDDALRIRESLDNAIRSGEEQEIEFRVCSSEDSPRWIRAQGRAEIDARTKRAFIRGVVQNVTEQHSTREEIEDLRNNLAHASRVTALGQFTSALAHELRQPLGAILTNVQAAQLMMRAPDPDLHELSEILTDIYRDDRRAADVIDRLHALLKRRPMDFQPVAMSALLQDVLMLVKVDAAKRGVTIETAFERSALVALGDRVHLSQVLINLIANGMDAMANLPEAERKIAVRVRTSNDESIEVAVTDAGPGVAPDMLTKIFQPFVTTKPAGMGMGLAISRTIVDAHRGRIWVENNAAGGATFRFTVPVYRQETQADERRTT